MSGSVRKKFVAKVSIFAVTLGLFSVIGSTQSNAHTAVTNGGNATNISLATVQVDASLVVATTNGIAAAVQSATAIAGTFTTALSSGLITKDASSGTAQTATVRTGGILSLYARTSTIAAMSATGGTFSGGVVASGVNTTTAATYNAATTAVLFASAGTYVAAGTPIAVLYTAPTIAGTYTVTLDVSGGTAATTVTTTDPTAGTAAGIITVTVTDTINGTTVSTSASNRGALVGAVDASLFVANLTSDSGAAVVSDIATAATAHTSAKSIGLLSTNGSVGVGKTATVLTSGVLSLYASVSTDIALVATSGTFGTAANAGATTFSQDKKTVFRNVTAATALGQLWTAPSTAGTYTISAYSQGVSSSDGTNTVSLASPSGGTLIAQITVTVTATSAGGSYSPIYSVCNTSSTTSVPGSTAATANVDSTSTVTNGNVWYINFALADSYQNALDNGNIVVTATNGAFVNYAEAGTAAVGTGSTVVSYNNANAYGSVTVSQPIANAPITTTVTVSYNGTTVCTKTVTIRGEVAKIAVSNIITQDLSGSAGVANASWIDDTSGRAGLFTVLATDSAGNQVATTPSTGAIGTWAASAASLAGQTIVTALSVDNSATATSSTSPSRYSTGIYTCGATAGEVKTAKLTFTNAGSATVVTSDAFTLRCSDDPYTYTASWDKASYVQGEIATLTVKFLDSKGFAANNKAGAAGGWTGSTPMLTPISATGSAPVLDNAGTKTYTYSVGGNTAITAGSYVSVIDFASLTAGTKQTPSYKVSTGGDSTTNADVLKSIVALIASINKQIQALQKLILKR